MNDRLREAIAVARSGETREAQLLVADILEDSPDNAQAWYLMSHLVESPARRAVYLSKAVSLDPDNQRAKAELAEFPPTVTEALASSLNGAATSSTINITTPDTLAEVANSSAADLQVQDDVVAVAAAEIADTDVQGVDIQNGSTTDVPEWLQPIAGETPQRQPVVATSVAATSSDEFIVTSPVAEHAPAKTQRAKRRQKQDRLLMAMIIGLVIVTLIVLGLLLYLLLL